MFANKFRALDQRLEEIQKQDVETQQQAAALRAQELANDEQYVRIVNKVVLPTVEDFARYAKQKHAKIVKYEIHNSFGFDSVRIYVGNSYGGESLTLTHHRGRTNLVVSGRDIMEPSIAFKKISAEWLIDKMIVTLF